MSWLKRVLGGRSAEEWLSDARDKEQTGELGEAKLAFDRAADAAGDQRSLREQAEAGSARCCDALARQRLAEAEKLRARGQIDLALEEVQQALETAQGSEMRERARAALHSFDRVEAVQSLPEANELSAEERFALLAGNWEPLQAEELEALGDPLAAALVKLESGALSEARTALDALVEAVEDPRYLWLEVGRARIACGDLDSGSEALRTFLARIGPDEGGNARLSAHSALAQISHDQGDTEAAIEELEACAAALEDDPRPLLQLGGYLRHAGRPGEAIEVIELCRDLFTDGPVEWPVLLELGLAQADAGHSNRAIATLEGIVELFAGRGELDFPAVLAERLASLHEAEGHLARAADLYSGLSRSGDTESRPRYLSEAARLLDALGLGDEAERMRERKRALEHP